MKIRFYSIKDLHEEVKGLADKLFVERVVRMQFLEDKYTQEYRGGKDSTYIPIVRFTLTLSVMSKDTVYYYSQPYAKCQEYELKDKLEAILEGGKKLELEVGETFKGWTVKKGVYEVAS